MNCRSAESLFSAFLDDELNQKERRGLEAHLLSCKRCSLSVRELRVALQLLDAMPQVETSPHFEEDVMARIRSGEAMRPSTIEWLRRWLEPAALRPVFLAGATACAVWIAVVISSPDRGFMRNGTPGVASTESAPVTGPTSSVASENGSGSNAAAPAPGTEVASAQPAASPGQPALTRERPGDTEADVAALDRSAASEQPVDGAAIPNPGARYVDEYITDQFYLERQVDGADPGITPVSGRPSDDVYITF